MSALYNILIYLASGVIPLFGLFNQKIKKGLRGRANTFSILKNKIQKTDKTLWFHCASLGEFEQGLPVFKAVIKDHPDHKVILSFFSPSGYEIKKNIPWADAVVYLPLDTTSNAKKFLALAHPELIIFVKYELWPNFLHEIKRNAIDAILISAVFKKTQVHFKWYGQFMKKGLNAFMHIFVQDEASYSLLHDNGFHNTTLAGDTRFDRVSAQLTTNNTLDFIETFKGNNICFVAGSTWPEDEKLLLQYINNNPSDKVKYVIAPHEIHESHISSLTKKLKVPYVLYSQMVVEKLATSKVLIIDTIGLLSKIYSYADLALVGGATGTTGLHNTLEAAVFGIPILIGPNYESFPEAKAMIATKGMFSFNGYDQFKKLCNELITNDGMRRTTGDLNATFIKNNKGAVIQIVDFIRTNKA